MDDAAFFDLDRTLLAGASGPMFSTMLKRVGVIPDRAIPGEGLLFRFFDVVGETVPSMIATRQMARAAAGWDRSLVQEAGRLAAQGLVHDPRARQEHPSALGSPVSLQRLARLATSAGLHF